MKKITRIALMLSITIWGLDSAWAALAVSPTSASVLVGGQVTFRASGGRSPYKYSTSAGSINSSGVFTAPGNSGSATITVTDAARKKVSASASVIARLSLPQSTVNMSAGGSLTISLTGGLPPYSFSLSAGTGSLSGGVYSAPAGQSGAATVLIQDSFNQRVSLNINYTYTAPVTTTTLAPVTTTTAVPVTTTTVAPLTTTTLAPVTTTTVPPVVTTTTLPSSGTAQSGMGPLIDISKIPSGDPGLNYDIVQTAVGDYVTPGDGIGAFRTQCNFSHMSFDDPIVFPNQPGRAHLHTFFGNTGTNAASTADSIATTGNSTCLGGTVNRSSYWVPSMIDTKNGAPVPPVASNFYYKSGYNGVLPAQIKPIPPGLRMIAGSAANAVPLADWEGHYKYFCHEAPDEMVGPQIPNCPVGSELWMTVIFPQCWDGVHLDSADHKSHMAYANNGCPNTHPIGIPEISFNIVYPVTEANSTSRWRLSSDNYASTLPAGYSAHGDYFFGWKLDIMNIWIKNCDNTGLDCHTYLLGNGQMLNYPPF